MRTTPGRQFVVCVPRGQPITPDRDKLLAERAVWDDNRANAWAALRMIRDVVEQHAPPGSVPPGEQVGPKYTDEAAAIVRGILAIVHTKSG